MARGPDGSGGGAGFSLADQLFNAASLGDLAAQHAVLPGFDPERFVAEALSGLEGRGVHGRLDWIASCLEAQLPRDFPAMAEALEAAMPAPLDPALRDSDFGRFIHAVPGVLAVRHGLEAHRERALDLLHAATQRFSMEYAIRPFLNRWPEETLLWLGSWAGDGNYHVRRLVSEGTRPRLPWGVGIGIDPLRTLPLLDALHGDRTRFVTRSVANHLNDLSKIAPEAVLGRLSAWRAAGVQAAGELDWMARHALRTAVKRGEPAALAFLGYGGSPVAARLTIATPVVARGGMLRFAVTLEAPRGGRALVDWRLRFHRPGGAVEKVFKLKAVTLAADVPLVLEKAHRMKGDATTFRLHPGPHAVIVQVNGQDVAEAGFELTA